MSFLALTSFEATLLALAVAGAVIALHFLKIYPHRVFVSSVVLWQRVLGEKFSRSLWERLQRIISILLAVTIALLIALSKVRPQSFELWTHQAKRRFHLRRIARKLSNGSAGFRRPMSNHVFPP